MYIIYFNRLCTTVVKAHTKYEVSTEQNVFTNFVMAEDCEEGLVVARIMSPLRARRAPMFNTRYEITLPSVPTTHCISKLHISQSY